ncbi:MAG: MCP four helix bundle domain-containing protein, partial [Gorillibacterium sp.]|nr:MCP four helix bundle domain-containing protein [Gorillibacterium sp.]
MFKKMIGSWTVGKKLYASFGVVLLLLVSIVGISLVEIEKMNQTTQEITEVWMLRSVTASQINYQVEHLIKLDQDVLLEADTTKLKDLDTQVQEQMTSINTDLERYKDTFDASSVDDDQRASLANLTVALADYSKLHTQFMELGQTVNIVAGAGQQTDQVNTLLTDVDASFAVMKVSMDELLKFGIEGGLSKATEAGNVTDHVKWTLYISGIVAILLSLILAAVITLNISKPVRAVSTALKKIAEGDLSQRTIQVRNKDEIGELVGSLNGMIANVRQLMGGIQETSALVAATSEQILNSSEQASQTAERVTETMQEVATGSENQQLSSEETARAMEEMAQGIQRIAEASSEVSDYSSVAVGEAHAGNKQIEQVKLSVNSIHDSVGKAGEQIHLLKARSQDIGQMVDIIRAISTQTNLLSLNAAIEAARAGEHGKGFAVVAGEVRKLAEQSNESAKKITELVAQVIHDTDKSVQLMNVGLVEVGVGLTAVQNAGDAFKRIVRGSEEVASKIQEVAASAEQMSASSEQVSASILEMNLIAKKASEQARTVAESGEEQLASMQEITASASSLSAATQDLNGLA